MNAENVKAWLLRYRDIQTDLDNQLARLDEMEAKIKGPRTAQLDGMPHGGGNTVDRIGSDLARLELLEAECREVIAAGNRVYAEIESAVKQIKGSGWADQRAVIRARYLDLCAWPDVAFLIFGKRSDFLDREDSFLRRVHQIHNRALVALTEILSHDFEGQEISSIWEDRK